MILEYLFTSPTPFMSRGKDVVREDQPVSWSKAFLSLTSWCSEDVAQPIELDIPTV